MAETYRIQGRSVETWGYAELTASSSQKTKIGTEVAHVTHDSDTSFKVKGQRSTCC